jgi:predicted metalloprotease with PDZ domain
MSRVLRVLTLGAVVLCTTANHAWAQAAVSYRLSFPQRVHRIMDVEATFADVPAGVLQLRISRSSPGRYALHQFAKNVFDVRITDENGQPLAATRATPDEWDVPAHPSTVRVAYRVFGDRVDGTYLSVDTTHAHINMPSAIMWARGFEMRPIIVRFDPPAGSGWRVATQLLPGTDPLTFTAPNLQYLMDSGTEVSGFAVRTFTMSDDTRMPLFRLAIHHTGGDAELDSFARDIQRIVREELKVFGEFPNYENNTYTFIADYLPWAQLDAMEHRNSTILTAPNTIRSGRAELLDVIAHEFFHGWNVERIRPRSLEPFNFDDVNMSGELWLAEGFTNYYGPLALQRAGLTSVGQFASGIGTAVNAVITRPGRLVRTAEEMSQEAPFVDAAASIDRTNSENTYISYYTWGQAIALGLDLTLRDRSDGRVTLDDFMRVMWQTHGKPGGRVTGLVDRPYTMADAKAALAKVSGDAAFADDFFRRFIQGHDVIDYAPLLTRAGLLLRPVSPGQAWLGPLTFDQSSNGVRIAALVAAGTPAYDAGLELDDIVVSLGGSTLRSPADIGPILQQRKPGDTLPVVFLRRGERVSAVLKLVADPRQQIVAAEEAGQPLTEAQKQFRTAWFSSGPRNVF